MRYLILILFIINCGFGQAQKRSKYEWKWAIFHPFAALKVKSISKKCYKIYNLPKYRIELDSFSNGGKLDAFQHVFFMTAFAQKVKIKKLRKLGIAHEKANYRMFINSCVEFGELPDSLSMVMDLQNNEFAFKISAETKKMALPDLAEYIVKEIKSGKALIMNRRKNGQYLTCDNKPIDLKLFGKQWNIPKCLVPSDSGYMD